MMNCKQIQELLPLYAGRDLEEKHEQMVAEHIQSCAECSGAAHQYRKTREWLQEFTTPAFNEGVYAGIRRRVLREIESESTASALPQLIAGLFRPRLTWAVATAVLAVISMFVVYFMVSRRMDPQQVANHSQGSTSAVTPSPLPVRVRGGSMTSGAPSKPVSAGRDELFSKQDGEDRQLKRRDSRNVFRHLRGSLAVNAPDAGSTVTDVAPQTNSFAEPDLFPAGNSEKTLRVEIQTKDPNIRIIWFSRSNTKPALPNSKGI